jgi:ABC-type cobalamin/Fe3+-siderophores transport system ATPase subunit
VLETTKLPATFTALSEGGFISLGQEDEYYQHLYSLPGQRGEAVLAALQDIAWKPALAFPFEPTTAFRNALMRFNTAECARRFGRSWVQGLRVHEQFSFSYSCQIEGAVDAVKPHFNFDAKDEVPGRVIGIIGRNAVGKTRFLAKLGEDLTHISRSSAESIKERDQRFPDGRPVFTRILAVSYSAFDRFRRPPPKPESSYVYCGIRNEKGNLSRTSLVETYRANQGRVRALQRQDQWTSSMRTILGDQSAEMSQSLLAEIANPNPDEEGLSILSSGQAILCHFATALLAWVQPNTLVLFDEPETHLHPNAVASLLLVLTEILNTYDSYAILATHSPVVIQQIPSKRVVVFRRTGNSTSAEGLPLESFGESVTELTRHVFETIEVESLYRRTLLKLARSEDLEDVIARFPEGLSMSAQAYLLAQYAGRKNRKE